MAEVLTRGKFHRYPHVNLINQKLIAMARGDIDRAAFALPPGHSKTSLVSEWHPAWRLALDPTLEIGIGSYNIPISLKIGYEVRRIVKEFSPEIGVEIVEDSKSVAHWRTSEGGRVVATSVVGGSWTSHHFHLIIIDDPVKGAEQAESPTYKEKVWDEYRRTLLSRLYQGGALCLVQTRWAVDDLMGRVLKQEGDAWDLTSLPAEAEPGDPLGRAEGEALCPEIQTKENLERTSLIMGTYGYTALYQQRPTPKSGGILKHIWWRYWVPRGTLEEFGPVTVEGKSVEVVELPEAFDSPVVQSWDMNFKKLVRAILGAREPDAVSGLVGARLGAQYFVLDRIYGRVGFDETLEMVRELTARNPSALAKVVEYAANGPDVMAKLRHEVGGFIPHVPIGTKMARATGMFAVGTDEDKHARAVSMAAAIQAGDFYLPHPRYKPIDFRTGATPTGWPWTEAFIHNLGLFPRDGKDDTDALSQLWAFLYKGEWKQLNRAHADALRVKEEPQSVQEAFQETIRKMSRREVERKPGPLDIYSRNR